MCLVHDYEPLAPDAEDQEGKVHECHCGARAVKKGDLMIEIGEYRRQEREPEERRYPDMFDMVRYTNGLLENWRVR
jgi:hypothetical protein